MDKYFVRYSYSSQTSFGSHTRTDFGFIKQDEFEEWLTHMEKLHLDFDLLIVNKM